MNFASPPILIDLPDQIQTERLLIRAPRVGDGAGVNEAIRESFDELRAWMPWAQELPSLAESETFVREAAVRYLRREDLTLLLFERDTGGLIGASGMHRIDWSVPSFEIGYWCRTTRTGQGFVTEAVAGICELAFGVLDANRVELRMDDHNERSWKVAERLGFTLEGLLRQDTRGPDGELRDTRVYAALTADQLDLRPRGSIQ